MEKYYVWLKKRDGMYLLGGFPEYSEADREGKEAADYYPGVYEYLILQEKPPKNPKRIGSGF